MDHGARQDRRGGRGRLDRGVQPSVDCSGESKIRVADIVAQANVGRSTFYEHYSGAEAIHLEALARPFAPLADAAAGAGDEGAGAPARPFLGEPAARRRASGRLGESARLLADLVEERLAARGAETVIARRLAAVQLAEAALAPLRAWISGEAACAPEALAASLCRTGRALAAALTRTDSNAPRAGVEGALRRFRIHRGELHGNIPIGAIFSQDGAAARPEGLARHFFFSLMLSYAIVAVIGFAPSMIQFKRGTLPMLGPPAHVHGMLMGSWLLLLVTQSALPARGHVAGTSGWADISHSSRP